MELRDGFKKVKLFCLQHDLHDELIKEYIILYLCLLIVSRANDKITLFAAGISKRFSVSP